jgi:hypothetical protein
MQHFFFLTLYFVVGMPMQVAGIFVFRGVPSHDLTFEVHRHCISKWDLFLTITDKQFFIFINVSLTHFKKD